MTQIAGGGGGGGGGNRALCVIMTYENAYENQNVVHLLLVPIKRYGF